MHIYLMNQEAIGTEQLMKRQFNMIVNSINNNQQKESGNKLPHIYFIMRVDHQTIPNDLRNASQLLIITLITAFCNPLFFFLSPFC